MKQFGGKVTKALTAKYSESTNWKDGKFRNLVETTMDVNLRTVPKLLYKQICAAEGRNPKKPIPIQSFDVNEFTADSNRAKFIWYGHSAMLMRINNKTILIDPMLGPDTSPIAPYKTKRFSENTLSLIDDFPLIDLVLLTHDHYDHLDMASIEKLIPKTTQFYVALGVGRHLNYWGADSENIKEFDWWDSSHFEGIDITFTPSRHFSGRGLTDNSKTLWGGWVLKTANESIYWSGDGGFGDHFKEVGERLGPFDMGFMECGQYNEHWHQIHMYPEEAIQAAKDADVKKAMAVHWAGFALAQHPWKEPIQRFMMESKNQNQEVFTPQIGQLFSSNDLPNTAWWEGLI